MKIRARFIAICCVLACLSLVAGRLLVAPVSGAALGARSLQLTDSTPGATATYSLALLLSTSGAFGSIGLQFCSNDPFPGTPCTPPVGFDASNVAIATQDGQTGFSVRSANPNNVVMGRSPAISPAAGVHYNLTGIKNPSNAGSYYARVQTYASNDATGPASDYGGIVFAINNNLTITSEVPPYLIFCTGITITGLSCANAQGNAVNFGELSSTQAKSGSSQMLVATNAAQGFTITAQGTSLTSGNNVITALAASDVSRPGTSQFGFNLRANGSPTVGGDPTGPGTSQPEAGYGQANQYRFVNGDTLVSDPGPEDVRVYTSGYVVNVPKTQAPGIYVSTITYLCLANF